MRRRICQQVEQHRILLICVYFGELPNYFNVFLKSCRHNPTVDWIVFTDDKKQFKLPPNVRVVYVEFQDVIERIRRKLSIEVNIPHPYKLCDFKPTYGVVFDEYVQGYHFWGHCDLDVIFGDIRAFINAELLDTYSKLLRRGHLTLYRNNHDSNRYYQLSHPTISYKNIFADSEGHAFDETNGIHAVIKSHNIPVFEGEIIANIQRDHSRYLLTDANPVKNRILQVFYWDNGKIFRESCDLLGKRNKDEFCYIHLQKRAFSDDCVPDVENWTSFMITPKGFVPKKEGRLSVAEFWKYNRFSAGFYLSRFQAALSRKSQKFRL